MKDELEKVLPDHSNSIENDSDKVLLQWRCHPLRRKPWVSIKVSIFVILVGVLVYYATDNSKAFATLALVVMFASLAKFYFPTSYKLTERNVIVKTTTQTLTKDWSIYRSFHPDKNGILLSTFARPTRLENFRGLYLMFSENRNEVIEIVKDRINSKMKDTAETKEKRT